MLTYSFNSSNVEQSKKLQKQGELSWNVFIEENIC